MHEELPNAARRAQIVADVATLVEDDEKVCIIVKASKALTLLIVDRSQVLHVALDQSFMPLHSGGSKLRGNNIILGLQRLVSATMSLWLLLPSLHLSSQIVCKLERHGRG